MLLTASASADKPKAMPAVSAKNMLDDFTAPLDILLSEQHITPIQHWAGIHLQWLHQVKFGCTKQTPTHRGSFTRFSIKNPEWAKAREEEYETAMSALSQLNIDSLMLQNCVYQHALPKGKELQNLLLFLTTGLDVVVNQWTGENSKF